MINNFTKTGSGQTQGKQHSKRDGAIFAGEELFTAYENASISTWPVARYPSCHEHMLIRYGFTDGATARDCFHIFVDPEEFMQPSDPEDEAEGEDYRLGILAQENLGPRPIYIWAIHSDLHGTETAGWLFSSTMRLPLIGQHRSIFIGDLGLCWIYFDRIIANA